jgi:hypothetical protein
LAQFEKRCLTRTSPFDKKYCLPMLQKIGFIEISVGVIIFAASGGEGRGGFSPV